MPGWVLLIWIAICLLEIFHPRLTWFLTEGWKFKDAEPSEAYLTFSRVMGVVMLIVGLIFYANTRT